MSRIPMNKVGRTPRDQLRTRRFTQRLSRSDFDFGNGLSVDEEGLVAVDAVAPITSTAAGVGLSIGDGLVVSGDSLVIDLASTEPGLQFVSGDLKLLLATMPGLELNGGLKALVQGVLAIDASGIKLNFGSGLTNNGGTLEVNASAIDHGGLAGLADDDHTQYHTDARALTWLGTRSTSDLSEGSNLYFTDSRAVAAVAAADDYVLNTGDAMTGGLRVQESAGARFYSLSDAANPADIVALSATSVGNNDVRLQIGQEFSTDTTFEPWAEFDRAGNLVFNDRWGQSSVVKNARFQFQSYDTAEENAISIIASAQSANNFIDFGGGASAFNCATDIRFWTGAINTLNGTRRMVIDSVGRIGVNENSPSAQLDLVNNAAARVAVYIEAAGSQSANLLEVRDSGGTLLAHVDENGDFVAQSYTDASRPAAGKQGRMIFNSDDGQLNVDDGTNWTLPDGTTT